MLLSPALSSPFHSTTNAKSITLQSKVAKNQPVDTPDKVTHLASEAPVPQRRLIRTLTVIAGLLTFVIGASGLLQTDWEITSIESLLEHLLGIGLLAALSYLIYRAWNRPSAKTDRSIMILCIGCGTFTVITPLSYVIPVETVALFSGASLLLSLYATAKIYHRLEAEWTQAGEIYPLAKDSVWPTEQAWKIIRYLAIFSFIGCLVGTLIELTNQK